MKLEDFGPMKFHQSEHEAERRAIEAGLKLRGEEHGRWLSITFVLPPVSDPKQADYIQRIAKWAGSVKPWLLEDITPNPTFVVAARLTILNRLRVWWLNIGRRAKARELSVLRDAHLMATQRPSLSAVNLAQLSLQSQHHNTTDAPN